MFDNALEVEHRRPRRESILGVLNRHNGSTFVVMTVKRSTGEDREFQFVSWGGSVRYNAAIKGLVQVHDLNVGGDGSPRMMNLDGVRYIDVEDLRYDFTLPQTDPVIYRHDGETFTEITPQDLSIHDLF